MDGFVVGLANYSLLCATERIAIWNV